ncbi:acyl-CoA/acyl-ACP dehydrogenase [Alicyclobacillus tolerans]|uniref:acyl-CoA dehydrogenase family protein n=1 Tax=Alicyclobacillus tolerans TaxID=90970 RepID=UPI001F2771EB|nr:acyl-CoA dehydrogenase family protein [Alicyclobacillus tolerans]MCF8564089.1 acyl-CoA/acyl-ACP dehydrogenase [Alicyclobacillus tolerans]
MDFSLSPEQEMFGSSVRKLIESLGQTQIARRFMEGDARALDDVKEGFRRLECMAVNVPEAFGGLGLSNLDTVPLFEELGRAVVPGEFPETTAFAVPLLTKSGTPGQQQFYLPKIAAGHHFVTLAWLEPQGQFDAASIQLTARKQKDTWVLNGTKTLVPHADAAKTLVVPARTESGGVENGVTLFLVDAADARLQRKRLNSFDGTRSLLQVDFHEVEASEDQVLGPVGGGWPLLSEGSLHLTAAWTTTMVGSLQRVVEMSAQYASTRVQFGQPIGRFQAVKHRIAEMKLDLETARSLTYYANWALQSDAPDRVAAVAAARVFVTQALITAAGHNIQIHGGIGFTWELDCHLYLKRARSLENYLGTPDDFREKTALAMGW